MHAHGLEITARDGSDLDSLSELLAASGVAADVQAAVERQAIDGRDTIDSGHLPQLVENGADELRRLPGVGIFVAFERNLKDHQLLRLNAGWEGAQFTECRQA